MNYKLLVLIKGEWKQLYGATTHKKCLEEAKRITDPEVLWIVVKVLYMSNSSGGYHEI